MSERKRLMQTISAVDFIVADLMALLDDLEEDVYDIDCEEAAEEAAEADAYDDLIFSEMHQDDEEELFPSTFDVETQKPLELTMNDFIRKLFEGTV
jgi:hypothetical protein